VLQELTESLLKGEGSYLKGEGSYLKGEGSYLKGEGSYLKGEGSYLNVTKISGETGFTVSQTRKVIT